MFNYQIILPDKPESGRGHHGGEVKDGSHVLEEGTGSNPWLYLHQTVRVWTGFLSSDHSWNHRSSHWNKYWLSHSHRTTELQQSNKSANHLWLVGISAYWASSGITTWLVVCWSSESQHHQTRSYHSPAAWNWNPTPLRHHWSSC